MKKDYSALEWNQQDRRRSTIGKGGKTVYLLPNTPEYQKTMRRMRRVFGMPIKHAHQVSLAACQGMRGLSDESHGTKRGQ